MAFYQRTHRTAVTDQDGKLVGNLKDLVARKTSLPTVHPGNCCEAPRRELILPYTCVAVLFSPAIALKCSEHDTHPYRPDDSDIYLARDVLDKQIIDTDGARVVRVMM